MDTRISSRSGLRNSSIIIAAKLNHSTGIPYIFLYMRHNNTLLFQGNVYEEHMAARYSSIVTGMFLAQVGCPPERLPDHCHVVMRDRIPMLKSDAGKIIMRQISHLFTHG